LTTKEACTKGQEIDYQLWFIKLNMIYTMYELYSSDIWCVNVLLILSILLILPIQRNACALLFSKNILLTY
jgi:hypothetical protein